MEQVRKVKQTGKAKGREVKHMKRFSDTDITDSFFKRYYDLVIKVMMPYQWEALNDNIPGAEKSHAVENIKIAAGVSRGDFYGRLFQDSDFAKWLEALGYCMQKGDLREFEDRADEVIGYIEKAQQPDGYFNTYFQLTAPDRKFTNLYEAHELYCAGHFIEAAVSYYEATGKTQALDVAIRLADLVDSRFGTEDGKIRGYGGHQEIELALIKLYETTGEDRYLKLALYFLNERGREPNFFRIEAEKRDGFSEYSQRKQELPDDFSYNQAHKPVREQEEAVGHAVRAVYMYTAMAEAARITGDIELFRVCVRLFDNIVQKQMYVTGSVGSTSRGEAFTFDYDLPGSINYSETCASIGLIFFANSMLKLKKDSKYANVIELALFNTVLASIQTDGKSYLYVNPMEVVPEASERNPDRAHVKPVRQPWYGCACCPPNIARLLASLERYIYSRDDGVVYIHQYISSKYEYYDPSGEYTIEINSNFPDSGDVRVRIGAAAGGGAGAGGARAGGAGAGGAGAGGAGASGSNAAEAITGSGANAAEAITGSGASAGKGANAGKGAGVTVALRIPDWSRETCFTLNDVQVTPDVTDGYAYFRACADGDVICAGFSMTVDFIHANTALRDASGKAVVKRGPLVYCLEETDNVSNLHRLSICKNGNVTLARRSIAGTPFTGVSVGGIIESDSDGKLYSAAEKLKEHTQLNFIPYFLWGNREQGEMICWVRETE